MAERSSELEQLNDFGTEDRAPDDNAAARIAAEIGIADETGAATARATDTDADTNVARTSIARSSSSSEVDSTTTSGATATFNDDDDDDDADDNTTLSATTDDAAASSVSPPDAIVDASAAPEEIKASIENTRSEMTETINAIQEKLSISNLTNQVKEEVTEQISGAYETVKHALFGATIGKAGGFFEKMKKQTNQFTEDYGPALSEAGTTVVHTAKSNPIPVALIGLGIGMLLFGGGKAKKRKVKSYRYRENYNDQYASDYADTELDYDYSNRTTNSARSYTGGSARNQSTTASSSRSGGTLNRVGGAANSAYKGVSSAASSAVQGVSGVAGSAYSGVSSAASSAVQGVSSVAGTVSGQVGNLGTGAKQVARRAADTYERQLDENPYSVGAVAFALGAVVGLALPSTSTENVLMGEYRENLLQKAQEAAGGVIDKVQQVAGEVTKTVQEEAKAQGLSNPNG